MEILLILRIGSLWLQVERSENPAGNGWSLLDLFLCFKMFDEHNWTHLFKWDLECHNLNIIYIKCVRIVSVTKQIVWCVA